MEQTYIYLIAGGVVLWLVLLILSFVSKRHSKLKFRKGSRKAGKKHKQTRTQAVIQDRNYQNFATDRKMWKPEKSRFGLVEKTSTVVTQPRMSLRRDANKTDDTEEPEMTKMVYTPDNLSEFVKGKH